MRVIALAVAVALCGCETPREACQAYGHQPGTTEFAQCLERKDAEEAERHQRALLMLGIGLMNANEIRSAPVVVQPPVYCYRAGTLIMCQ